ncbi:GET complex subunit get1 [Vermiconidia calcicola]|uniref:GET complex subunit get1 n=1 Tax=Vermiconidia calcicola TaxID=1690605 RepID=A0ACC3N1R3_9PEZI|nr:GET complex subunit get1 [Vermiconidia calcicola]
MPSFLLLVFLLQLVIHLLNTVGKQHVNELLWLLFTKLPISQNKESQELAKLRDDVMRLNTEMRNTSAQDEFAKWAKLRRQHDKAKDKYDAKAAAQQSFRQSFDRITTAARWLGTQGLQFFCNTWYSKQPMFWLPQGWVPYGIEWVLSFPRAPVGSISVNVWAIACASVIKMVFEGGMALWTLRTGVVKVGPRRGEKVRMEAVGMGGGGAGEKKEL